MKDNNSLPKNNMSSESLQDLINRWTQQHNTLENYVLGWLLTFRIMHLLGIKPLSRKGVILRFSVFVIPLLGLPVIATAIANEWEKAPIFAWMLITISYGLISLTYNWYKNASKNNCSLSYTVTDKTSINNHIKWDRYWFNIRWSLTSGILSALAITTAIFLAQKRISGLTIPTGTYFVIAMLGYQIGENTWNHILMCIEAYRFADMRHRLYRLRPADTATLHQSLRGYNQIGALNSLFLTVFIGGFALLLREQHYLTDPIFLAYILVAYIVIGLQIFIPRLTIQRIVQMSKMQEMISIQNLINPLYDRIHELSVTELDYLKQLDEIHEIVQSSSENFLPFSTFGRVIGTLFFPTITFILAVASEAYLANLLERILR